MLLKEAEWINTQIEKLPAGMETNFCVNLGSSTSDFVMESQPYIFDLVVNPLASKFKKVINVDIKDAQGVDLIANFLTAEGRSDILKIKPKVYLVSNLLEHIPSPTQGAESLISMLRPGDILILTGPRFYPFHPDPIDNKFRPSRQELKKIFSRNFKILKLEYVWGGSVLTANRYSVSKTDLYLWSKRQLSFRNVLQNPKHILRTLRNVFYPAVAFCGVFEKL